MYAMGEQKTVIVDDYLPTNSKGKLVMSKPGKDKAAWWAVLLEKGFAKMHVNYSRLAGGMMAEGLHTFTGMPVRGFMTKKLSDDQVWNILKKGDENHWAMTAGCNGSYGKLVGKHAYTIIGVQELVDDAGKVLHRLIKMRNPWAGEKYEGDWYDKDDKWTPEFKKQAGLVDKDDGTFFVPLEKFRKPFGQIQMAMYQHWEKQSLFG